MEDSREMSQCPACKMQCDLTCLMTYSLKRKVTVAEGGFGESVIKFIPFCYLEWLKCIMRCKTI